MWIRCAERDYPPYGHFPNTSYTHPINSCQGHGNSSEAPSTALSASSGLALLTLNFGNTVQVILQEYEEHFEDAIQAPN